MKLTKLTCTKTARYLMACRYQFSGEKKGTAELVSRCQIESAFAGEIAEHLYKWKRSEIPNNRKVELGTLRKVDAVREEIAGHRNPAASGRLGGLIS